MAKASKACKQKRAPTATYKMPCKSFTDLVLAQHTIFRHDMSISFRNNFPYFFLRYWSFKHFTFTKYGKMSQLNSLHIWFQLVSSLVYLYIHTCSTTFCDTFTYHFSSSCCVGTPIYRFCNDRLRQLRGMAFPDSPPCVPTPPSETRRKKRVDLLTSFFRKKLIYS